MIKITIQVLIRITIEAMIKIIIEIEITIEVLKKITKDTKRMIEVMKNHKEDLTNMIKAMKNMRELLICLKEYKKRITIVFMKKMLQKIMRGDMIKKKIMNVVMIEIIRTIMLIIIKRITKIFKKQIIKAIIIMCRRFNIIINKCNLVINYLHQSIILFNLFLNPIKFNNKLLHRTFKL